MAKQAEIKFLYNGIKVNGVLYKAWYWKRDNYIDIHAKDYSGLPADIGLAVANGTDTMTDYFEKDSARIQKGHRFYDAALEAFEKYQAHQRRLEEGRKRRRAQKKGGR